MATEQSAPREDDVEGPEIHVPHAPHTGHRWWDFAIGGTALLVSVISLYVAVHHGEIMEKLVAANSWPNVDVDVSIEKGDLTGSVQMALNARNNGVGPARVETLEVFANGKPLADATAVLAAIKSAGDGSAINARLDGATILGEVLGAKEGVTIVRFMAVDGAKWAAPMITAGNTIQTRTCYCSVFDECFIADTRLAERRPKEVDACPAVSAGFNDRIGELLSARNGGSAKPAG